MFKETKDLILATMFTAYYLSINKAMTHLMRFILEGYDNEFYMTTIDKDIPLIKVLAMKGSEDIFMAIVEDLKEKIGIELITIENNS